MLVKRLKQGTRTYAEWPSKNGINFELEGKSKEEWRNLGVFE
jgi:hypothetical protein